jgi:hypothetical protein
MTARVLRAVVLLSVIAASVAQWPHLRRAKSPIEQSTRGFARSGERLAVVSDNWNGLLFDYYVYPRPTKLYADLTAYRLDAQHPRTIVYVTDRARLMPYEAIRAEQMTGFIAVPHYAPAGTHFLVPLVTSTDGYPPAVYTTEAWLRAPRATVRMTLWPRGIVKTLTIGGASFVDLVQQCFGVLESGWLEVESDAPLEASFAFVNRGTRKAAPLRTVPMPAAGTWRVAGGERLWIIDDHALVSRAATFPVEVRATYAFGTRKLPDGNTEFIWP